MTSTHSFKMVLVGNSFVGKTSIVRYFIQGPPETEEAMKTQPTLAVAYLTKKIQIGRHSLILELWDTAGQERFRSITPLYFKSSRAVLCCYDITDSESFKDLQYWSSEIHKHVGEGIVVAIVGNKADLESKRQVSIEEGTAYAEKQNAIFYEVSALDGKNVTELFLQIGKALLDQDSASAEESGDIDFNAELDCSTTQSSTSKSGCCS